MPILHIIAEGPPASGKSRLVRHLAENPPKGFELVEYNAAELMKDKEHWALRFRKIKARKK